MTCDARPFPNDTEVACEVPGEHSVHQGGVRDYAYPGSHTRISWLEEDRRNYHGTWFGPCPLCPHLPVGHSGSHTP